MNFVDTRFVEALRILSAEGKPRARNAMTENRRSTRVGLHVPIQVRLDSADRKDPWIIGNLRDISLRGLCIDLRKPLEKGLAFAVRFHHKSYVFGDGPLPCRVANCQKTREGAYRIGCEFTGPQGARGSQEEVDRIRSSILG